MKAGNFSLSGILMMTILLSMVVFGNGFNAAELSPDSAILTSSLEQKKSPQVTQTPDKQLHISVAIKQKKKVTLVAVKNDDDEPVFGFKIKIMEGNIKFAKARSWDRDRIDQNTVIVKTNDKPIDRGRSMIIILVTDNPNASYEWAALDKNNNEIARGNLVTTSEVPVKHILDELNFTVNEYKIPANASYVFFPLYDQNRKVIWISDAMKPRIWAFSLESKEFKTLEHEGKSTYKIALDSKQRLWFIDNISKIFGYVDPEKGSGKSFKPPIDGFLAAITLDRNDNVWMAISDKDKIVSFNPTTEEFKIFDATAESAPSAMLIDRFGMVWFTEASAGKLGKLDPTTGNIAEYQPPDGKLVAPSSIIQDSKGYIWLGEHGGLNLTRFDPDSLSFKRFSIPDKEALTLGMVEDIYGNIWYAQHEPQYIAVLDPRTAETSEIRVPSAAPSVLWLTMDEEGRIWFAEPNNAKIGSITVTKNTAK